MIIVQVSDVHRSRSILERLKRLSEDSEMLVISGDVTTFGEPSYFQQFMKALTALKSKVIYVPGNNDKPDFSVPDNIENLDGKRISYAGVSIGGLGGSPPTPFNTPYEVQEEELKRKLEGLGYVDILVSHSPPVGTPADRLENGGHAGSKAVREYIATYNPRLVLCGHVHEAVAKFKLGESLVINPGSAASGRYARINYGSEIVATLSLF
ncbi:MAG: metallophosphoesterase family protein [Conexivisphaerales archaeon]